MTLISAENWAIAAGLTLAETMVNLATLAKGNETLMIEAFGESLRTARRDKVRAVRAVCTRMHFRAISVELLPQGAA